MDLGAVEKSEEEKRLAIENGTESGGHAAGWAYGQERDASADAANFGTEIDYTAEYHHGQSCGNVYVGWEPWPPAENPDRRWNKRLWRKVQARVEDPEGWSRCWHWGRWPQPEL